MKNGTCRGRTVLAMRNRLGENIVVHNFSCIDPRYGPSTVRTFEFQSHTVAFKSTEPFLPVITSYMYSLISNIVLHS